MKSTPLATSTLCLEKHPWGVIAGCGLEGDMAIAEPLPREAMRLVIHLISGLHDRKAAPLVASWGAQANLVADFATRTVTLDPLAQRALGAHQGLPQLLPGAGTGDDALVRGLDDVAWDLGQVCGRFRLLGACRDGWEQRLQLGDGVDLRRLLRLPVPLPLARLMFAEGGAAFTPAQAQASCGLDARTLRGVLQACLFLGLLRWQWTPEEGCCEPGLRALITESPR